MKRKKGVELMLAAVAAAGITFSDSETSAKFQDTFVPRFGPYILTSDGSAQEIDNKVITDDIDNGHTGEIPSSNNYWLHAPAVVYAKITTGDETVAEARKSNNRVDSKDDKNTGLTRLVKSGVETNLVLSPGEYKVFLRYVDGDEDTLKLNIGGGDEPGKEQKKGAPDFNDISKPRWLSDFSTGWGTLAHENSLDIRKYLVDGEPTCTAGIKWNSDGTDDGELTITGTSTEYDERNLAVNDVIIGMAGFDRHGNSKGTAVLSHGEKFDCDIIFDDQYIAAAIVKDSIKKDKGQVTADVVASTRKGSEVPEPWKSGWNPKPSEQVPCTDEPFSLEADLNNTKLAPGNMKKIRENEYLLETRGTGELKVFVDDTNETFTGNFFKSVIDKNGEYKAEGEILNKFSDIIDIKFNLDELGEGNYTLSLGVTDKCGNIKYNAFHFTVDRSQPACENDPWNLEVAISPGARTLDKTDLNVEGPNENNVSTGNFKVNQNEKVKVYLDDKNETFDFNVWKWDDSSNSYATTNSDGAGHTTREFIFQDQGKYKASFYVTNKCGSKDNNDLEIIVKECSDTPWSLKVPGKDFSKQDDQVSRNIISGFKPGERFTVNTDNSKETFNYNMYAYEDTNKPIPEKENMQSSHTLTAPDEPGRYTIRTNITDKCGNTKENSISFTVEEDMDIEYAAALVPLNYTGNGVSGAENFHGAGIRGKVAATVNIPVNVPFIDYLAVGGEIEGNIRENYNGRNRISDNATLIMPHLGIINADNARNQLNLSLSGGWIRKTSSTDIVNGRFNTKDDADGFRGKVDVRMPRLILMDEGIRGNKGSVGARVRGSFETQNIDQTRNYNKNPSGKLNNMTSWNVSAGGMFNEVLKSAELDTEIGVELSGRDVLGENGNKKLYGLRLMLEGNYKRKNPVLGFIHGIDGRLNIPIPVGDYNEFEAEISADIGSYSFIGGIKPFVGARYVSANEPRKEKTRPDVYGGIKFATSFEELKHLLYFDTVN